MKTPRYLIFFLIFASLSCSVRLDLEGDIIAGAEGAVAWMTPLPDDRPVASLSIPGAHDAATAGVTAWKTWTQTQDLDIAALWNCGVRAFDLRPALVGGTMGIYHDKYSCNVTFPEVMKALILALEKHPGEGAIVLIRHEEEADGNNPEWGAEMGRCLAGLREHLVDYRDGLTLGQLRGKILVLSRNEYAGGPHGAYIKGWTSGTDVSAQKRALLMVRDGPTCPFWVQDYYHPNGAEDKWAQVKGLLDAVGAGPAPLTVNHASGYVGTLPDYRSNARDINARAAEYIRASGKPAGIVMMDFAGVDRSSGKEVAGKTLIKALLGPVR